MRAFRAVLGMSYELIITFLIIIFMLLFFLYPDYQKDIGMFFLQMSAAAGLVVMLVGIARANYDMFYVGLILFIVPIALGSALVNRGVVEGLNLWEIYNEITLNLASIFYSIYQVNPLLLAIVIGLVILILRNK